MCPHPIRLSIPALALAGLLLAGCAGPSTTSLNAGSPSTTASGTPSPTKIPTTATPTPTPIRQQLPGGGTTIFPSYRLAGFCGYPGAERQGRLGIGNLEDRMAEMKKSIAPYADGRKIMPVMELIASTVHPTPGVDGTYRIRTSPEIIKTWHDTAQRHGAMLLLNIQPGNADFLTEVQALEQWLVYPDVGVALDPEWATKPGEVPGRVFGSTTGAKLNEVANYLSELVAKHHLPEKILLYHQLNLDIVKHPEQFQPHPGVVPIVSVDGIGSPEAKIATYRRIVAATPEFVHKGFKLFYEEDVQTSGVLMTPAEVMALAPVPEYVLYE